MAKALRTLALLVLLPGLAVLVVLALWLSTNDEPIVVE